MPGHADKVAPLDELVKKIECFVPEVGLPYVELDLAILVPEVGKDGLAMVADDIQPPGGGDALFALLVGDPCKLRPDIRYRVLPVEGGGVEVDTFLPQCTYFVEPGLVECKGFTRIGHGNAPGQVG